MGRRRLCVVTGIRDECVISYIINLMLSRVISRFAVQRFSTEGNKVVLPDLQYGYSALEPVISSKLLETHHKKHHQTYVNNLNAALDQFEGTPRIT
jgi:hypothetical protein